MTERSEHHPIIIGLAGPRGAGKHTVADFICQETTFRRVSFIDPIRRIGSSVYNLSYQQMTDPILSDRVMAEWALSPVQILEKIAEDGRQIHSETWIRVMDRTMAQQPQKEGWVILDCRFQDELQFIRERGGVVWWVERLAERPGREGGKEVILATKCDEIIFNRGDRETLKRDTLKALAKVHEKQRYFASSNDRGGTVSDFQKPLSGMKYVDQIITPKIDVENGVNYGKEGKALVIQGEISLVWQPGSTYWSGWSGNQVAPSSLGIRGRGGFPKTFMKAAGSRKP